MRVIAFVVYLQKLDQRVNRQELRKTKVIDSIKYEANELLITKNKK